MTIPVGIGCYLEKDYYEILSISEDRENLNQTWEGWKKEKKIVEKNLKKNGIVTIDIIVKPDELMTYCRNNGYKVNGESRARYISFKTKMKTK